MGEFQTIEAVFDGQTFVPTDMYLSLPIGTHVTVTVPEQNDGERESRRKASREFWEKFPYVGGVGASIDHDAVSREDIY